MEFEKIESFGKLSDKKNAVEFCWVNWGSKEKYDLRRWSEDGVPYKGVTLEEDEVPKLLECLKEALDKPKELESKYTVEIARRLVDIYDAFGPLAEGEKWCKYVTFIDWGQGVKYDVRPWAKGFERCGKGVTLTHEECKTLIEILEDLLEHDIDIIEE